ncbi:family 43 glycosylhydrolase [candidate division KSB1 bacterium]|nr:family 43 glycosylhydrolase [candidate division KSB1 bacterium]
MKKFLFINLITLLLSYTIYAQNPVVPPGVYIADPSAHVWQDGKMYVYGSLDESPNYYCSWRHHVLSSDDLKKWTIHENRFASKGENDQVPYSDHLLFAPDCQFKDGTYYLYYCMPDPKFAEGVATSNSPTGPFMNGKNIPLVGKNQIDPCVFIDDDGQSYYIWGQFTAKMAKLKPNMVEIDESTVKDSIVTEGEHFFHEGAYLVKRNGIYYFIYAHIGRAQMPTCIGYATSRSPMGPYQYGGVIVDNDHCDPGNWNNHGSLVEFKGQWYVFYHRSTHGCNTMRKACVEPITFNPDGSIDEVEMTSQGAGGPLNALETIDAERACLLFGNVRIEAISADNEALMKIHPKDRVVYKYIDFGDGVDSVSVRVAHGIKAGKIDLCLDMPWHQSVGAIQVPGNGDGKTWLISTGKVEKVKGVHALWLRFSGEGEELFSVDWVRFGKK